MVCRLCLIESVDSIVIFSQANIQKYIMKYLKLELSPEDPISKVICSVCWQQLENFEKFCFQVEEAQKTLFVVNEKLKKEVNLNSNEPPATEQDPFAVTIPDPSLDALKKEIGAAKSDDFDDAEDSFQYMDEEIIKVELNNDDEEPPKATAPEADKLLSTRRITRGTKLKRPPTPVNETPESKQKRRCRQAKKSDVKSNTPPPADDNEDKEKPSPVINEKRRRGRPKKGEERPKVVKVRSEKGEKILETAKQFDEIIQKNMNLVCNICGVSLIDFAELKRHFRAVHNRKGYAVCCNKRLYKRGLVVDHINTHNNPEHFKCTDCGKVMADRMCLRNHVLLLHQNEDDKVFQCPYCPKKYAKQYLLEHHRVKHIPKEECTFFCPECKRGFPTKTTLTKHLNQIHSSVYDKMCEICAKIIRGNVAFERHMEEHEGIVHPQVKCEICGSWLKDKNSLRKHMYKHDGKTYSCNLCGKSAPSKSALQSHLRYVHQTVRKFHCTFCDKSFKKAVNLREHLTTHTGEVLYTCPHCPKTFNSKANMHAHRKKKHREEWEANRRYNVKKATIPGTPAAPISN